MRPVQPRFLVLRVRALVDPARHDLGHELLEVVDAFLERPGADRLRDELEGAIGPHDHDHAFAVLEVPRSMGQPAGKAIGDRLEAQHREDLGGG